MLQRMDVLETRKTLKLTQAQLAEQIGVATSTISRMESGDIIPNARTIMALESLLARRTKSRA